MFGEVKDMKFGTWMNVWMDGWIDGPPRRGNTDFRCTSKVDTQNNT